MVCGEALVVCGEALVVCGEALVVCGEALVDCGEALVVCGEAVVVCEALVVCGEVLVVCGETLVVCEALVVCGEALVVCGEALVVCATSEEAQLPFFWMTSVILRSRAVLSGSAHLLQYIMTKLTVEAFIRMRICAMRILIRVFAVRTCLEDTFMLNKTPGLQNS